MQSKTPRVDLGLAISGALLPPGRTRTTEEIAAYCGCSKQAISQIEKRTLLKLRRHGKCQHLFDALLSHYSSL